MKEGTVHFQILRPAPILNADGQVNWQLAAIAPTLTEAFGAVRQLALGDFMVICASVILVEYKGEKSSPIDLTNSPLSPKTN